MKPRPDGAKARCGGPALCLDCAREQAQHRTDSGEAANSDKPSSKRTCVRCARRFDMAEHRDHASGHEDLYCPTCLKVLITR